MTSETTPISGIPEDVEAFLLQSLHDRVSTLMPTLVRDLLANAYSVGFKAGQETLTVRLKDFLSEDTGYTVWPRDAQTRAVSEREPVPSPSSGLRDRAPRGAVRQAIFHALSTHPDGLNERELGVIMEQFNPNVSARSAGGELRRLKGSPIPTERRLMVSAR